MLSPRLHCLGEEDEPRKLQHRVNLTALEINRSRDQQHPKAPSRGALVKVCHDLTVSFCVFSFPPLPCHVMMGGGGCFTFVLPWYAHDVSTCFCALTLTMNPVVWEAFCSSQSNFPTPYSPHHTQ